MPICEPHLNQVLIDGQISEKKSLRYTPSGVPVSEARLLHESEVVEAAVSRQAQCVVSLIALGTQALCLDAAPLGVAVTVKGFLTAKSRNSKALVLHVQTLEFLEGK